MRSTVGYVPIAEQRRRIPSPGPASVEFFYQQGSMCMTETINGYSYSFYPCRIGDETVQVPQGVSRRPKASEWIIFIVSDAGRVVRVVPDNGEDPRTSVLRAHDELRTILEGGVDGNVLDRRLRYAYGPNDSFVYTGIEGVAIHRGAANQKAVTKRLTVTCRQPGNLNASFVGSISLTTFRASPAKARQQLMSAIAKAARIRHFLDRHEGATGASLPLHFDDLPDAYQCAPVELPELDLDAIFNSYLVPDHRHEFLTTGSNPERLAAKLQSLDLLVPHKKVVLQGHSIRFSPFPFQNNTLYLPTGLFRAPGAWRVRVYHSDGIFNDEVTDLECDGNPTKALQEAHGYLISLYRSFDCPTAAVRRKKYPLLDTCVTGVIIQPSRRFTENGEPCWAFTVKASPISDRLSTKTILSRKLENITNRALNRALCQATSLRRYVEYMDARYDIYARRRTIGFKDVPKRFHISEPVYSVSVDDLWFYVNQYEVHGKPPGSIGKDGIGVLD